jgi:predicted RNA-binding protein associated with RNAse of E/G family
VRAFRPGEAVALREVWRGRVWAARAATIVEDGPDQTAFFIPVGTTWMAAARGGRLLRVPREGFTLVEQRFHAYHVLSFAWPEVPYAVLRFFRPDWSPSGWYVNLQDPLRRHAAGFDTMDHELDVLVHDDGTWSWKDEHELAEAISLGVLTAEDEPRLRADGRQAVRRILEREPPFDRDWDGWRPDPDWPPPELPAAWDHV